jgi:hypothetical protein
MNGAVEKATKDIKNTGIASISNSALKTIEVNVAAITIQIIHVNTINLLDWFILKLP